MSWPDFEYLKVTTMTVIVNFKGVCLIEQTFPLLEITHLNLEKPVKQNKKFKIPYCGIPGAIVSANFQNTTRGIVKTKSNTSFRNSVTIDIATSKKNVNAKLCRNKIHMTGPDSKALAIETATHLINHVMKIQKSLDYINLDNSKKEKAIEWIKENTKGDDYIINSETQEIIDIKEDEYIGEDDILYENGNTKYYYKSKQFEWEAGDHVDNDNIICDKNGEPYFRYSYSSNNKPVMMVLGENAFITKNGETPLDEHGNTLNKIKRFPVKTLKVKSIVIPTEYPDNYPEGIDNNIVNFYIKYAPDYLYHHVFCQFLESVKQIEHVVTEPLEIDSVNMAMINYSYSLNMNINRWQLAKNINGINNFSVRYNNTTDHCVTISLPYKEVNGSKGVRRKNKQPCHTFMVYKSGIVTQSGPSQELMRGAYNIFMQTIHDIKDKIVNKGKPFNLKYIKKDVVTVET